MWTSEDFNLTLKKVPSLVDRTHGYFLLKCNDVILETSLERNVIYSNRKVVFCNKISLRNFACDIMLIGYMWSSFRLEKRRAIVAINRRKETNTKSGKWFHKKIESS